MFTWRRPCLAGLGGDLVYSEATLSTWTRRRPCLLGGALNSCTSLQQHSTRVSTTVAACFLGRTVASGWTRLWHPDGHALAFGASGVSPRCPTSLQSVCCYCCVASCMVECLCELLTAPWARSSSQGPSPGSQKALTSSS